MSSNQHTHEVQMQHSGDTAFVVVESFNTRKEADTFAAHLEQATQRPVRINSPLN